jgi:hypothetical protein
MGKKARGKLNEGYHRWQREFGDEYEAKTTGWEANYLEFALENPHIENKYLNKYFIRAEGV